MKARVILVCALIAGGITASATGDQADSSARGRIEGRAVFSGPDGAFTIAGVPPGRYTLEAWHERFGREIRSITIDRGQAASVSLTFEAR